MTRELDEAIQWQAEVVELFTRMDNDIKEQSLGLYQAASVLSSSVLLNVQFRWSCKVASDAIPRRDHAETAARPQRNSNLSQEP